LALRESNITPSQSNIITDMGLAMFIWYWIKAPVNAIDKS
jgi:hypothetical protein